MPSITSFCLIVSLRLALLCLFDANRFCFLHFNLGLALGGALRFLDSFALDACFLLRRAGLELLHATGAVEDFLFAGVEGMADTAQLDVDPLERRTGRVDGSASAGDDGLGVISWMNSSFHTGETIVF